jgi:hypothetical protein
MKMVVPDGTRQVPLAAPSTVIFLSEELIKKSFRLAADIHGISPPQ